MKAHVLSKSSFPLEGDLTHSPAGTKYSSVVDHLLARKDSSRQVLITSPGSDDGKTVTAVNLALAFHARHIPVVLVELSMQRPRFVEIFGASPMSSGVEAVLTGKKPLSAVVCQRNDNNFRLAMVNRKQFSDDLLAPGAHLDQLLAEAKKEYTWTIFDGPSVSASTHLPSLAKAIGEVIMVGRVGRTPRTSIQSAVETLNHRQTMLLLNDE